MRFLKQRRYGHSASGQPRAHRLTVIRWIYLASVLTLAIWLVNFSFGGLLYLQSEGLVLGEPGVVAAEFPVTVQDLPVRSGEIVEKGQIAAIVSSQTVAETIARLTADVAARQARRSELRIRSKVVDGLLALAQNRQQIATGARQALESLLSHHDLSLNQRTAAIDMEFRSYQDLESLKAEKSVVEGELDTLSAALAEAESAIGDLRKLYDNGQLRVPIDGVISRVVANKGSVVRAGEPLVELYGTQRFILAYMPTGALYDVTVGDEVQIKAGFQSARGVITRVEPFAAALPREFQRAFAPVETQQVIRVEFVPGETPQPLFTKVSLRSASFLPHWIDRTWAPRLAARPEVRVTPLAP
jgi:multidrug resistance efflux pump